MSNRVSDTFPAAGLEADLPATGLPRPAFYSATDTGRIWRSEDGGTTWVIYGYALPEGDTASDGYVAKWDDTTGKYTLAAESGGVGGVAFHGCRAVRSSIAQGLSNNTSTAVEFTAADEYDTDAIHDPTTNASRFTIPTGLDGAWSFKADVTFAGAASQTLRTLALGVNGSGTVDGDGFARVLNVPSVAHAMVTSADLLLAAGDYVELLATQVSGGSLNLNVAKMSCHYLGAP